MTKRVGYLVELNAVQFDEGSTQSWIQAMPIGEYQHPVYGKINITPERVQRFAANVKNHVRGTELDIDYDHKEYGGDAAGWVKDADARPDGLWVLVDWTQKAYDAIKSKAYKYFSPEFDDSWVHPKTGEKYQDVLFGGGITNRPFLKDILPLNLSEAFEHAADKQLTDGGGSMDPDQLKELCGLLGLPDDASGDQVLGALKMILQKDKKEEDGEPAPKPKDPAGPPAGGHQPPPQMNEEEDPQVDTVELSEQLKQLSEKSPAVKQLMDIVEAQGKMIESNNKKLKEAETAAAITKLNERAKAQGFALSPVAQDAISALLMDAPSQKFSDTVHQAFDTLLEKGLVAMGEKGYSRGGDQDLSATKKFAEVTAAIQKEDDKLTYADAVVRAAQRNPELFEQYQQESYAG